MRSHFTGKSSRIISMIILRVYFWMHMPNQEVREEGKKRGRQQPYWKDTGVQLLYMLAL